MKTFSFRFVPFLVIFLYFLVPLTVENALPDTVDVPPEIQRINTVGATAAGVPYAVHSRSVEEWTHRYVWPHDNANRTGVRWERFVDEAGHGLRVAAERL